MKNRVALVVHSCDRYQFLFRGFEIAFREYYPEGINAQLYFATETIDFEMANFSVIQSGKGEWSDRLRYLLEDKIKEDYVLYMQEDMWLSKKVDVCTLNEIITHAVSKKLDCVKLHSSGVYNIKPTEYFFGGLNLGQIINEESKFLMSHQITLWNKMFLIEQLQKNEHPWRNERRGTKRLHSQNATLHQIDLFSENGSPAINQNNKSIVNQSLYYTVSVNAVLNDIVKKYFELFKDKDASYLAEVIRHYENKLTHDGLSKPRKDDIFKKIKTWLKNL